MQENKSKKGKCYNEAFKRKVVGEVNSGLYSAYRTMKIYNIGDNNIINTLPNFKIKILNQIFYL